MHTSHRALHCGGIGDVADNRVWQTWCWDAVETADSMAACLQFSDDGLADASGGAGDKDVKRLCHAPVLGGRRVVDESFLARRRA